MIGSIFASTVLRGFKVLENNWQELCSNIRTGQISDQITDSGCRTAASLILKPNPELADLIGNICSCKSWDGIIRKLWPKTKYIGTICTGAMMQYTAELEFYCGGLPLVSSFYGCSEGALGINLEPLCKPSDVSYTFLPDAVYYEFVPIKEECITESPKQVEFSGVSQNESLETKSNDEDTEPVDLVNVKPGRCYELLVTNSKGLYRYRVGDVLMVTGFHNNTPQFRFVGRQNVALGVDVERTSEADLLKAVMEAKTLLDPLGFILTEYTSYGDTSSTPGHYVIFWELKAKEGNNGKELDPKVGDDEFGRMLANILKENNVDNHSARTALAFVTLRDDGEREFLFFRHPSADMILRESELDINLIKQTKIFHFGSISLIEETCKSAQLAAMNIAKNSGSILSYDLNLRLPLWPSAEAARKGIMSIWDQADLIKV
ncbi:hypothetical protein V6N13_016375 [Hibiscus sabdariffa]